MNAGVSFQRKCSAVLGCETQMNIDSHHENDLWADVFSISPRQNELTVSLFYMYLNRKRLISAFNATAHDQWNSGLFYRFYEQIEIWQLER